VPNIIQAWLLVSGKPTIILKPVGLQSEIAQTKEHEKKMKRSCAILWILGLAISFPAQSSTSPSIDAMKKLDFLAGEWKGDGWIEFGPGQRRTFTQSETVQPKLNGLLLQIEGLGKSKDPGREGAIIHNAFAIVSWDEKAKQIRWHAYTADGRYVETELKPVQERVVQWSIVSPGRTIRFTMDLSQKDQWLESGEFSQDGTKWMKFFEMKLQRVK
jgi:hypothetical protein